MVKVYYLEYTLYMTTAQLFARIGFSPRAARIFTALESKEPLLITELSVCTGLYRPTLYRELALLRKRGLVHTQKRGKRTTYVASDRSRIQEFFTADEHAVETFVAHSVASSNSSIVETHLHGPDGIQKAFDDVIAHSSRGDTFYRYTSERNLEQVNAYLAPGYRKRRDAKRLERLVISNSTSGSQKRSRLERFIRYMPEEAEAFNFDIIQLIYGNRVSFIDLADEHVVILENQALADFQKVLFKQLYKKL